MDEDGVIRLRRVISKLARQLNASSTDAGLTPSQASVLGLIVVRGPLSLGELADLEGLNPTMLSRVVSKLQAMGLIDRILGCGTLIISDATEKAGVVLPDIPNVEQVQLQISDLLFAKNDGRD